MVSASRNSSKASCALVFTCSISESELLELHEKDSTELLHEGVLNRDFFIDALLSSSSFSIFSSNLFISFRIDVILPSPSNKPRSFSLPLVKQGGSISSSIASKSTSKNSSSVNSEAAV